MFKIVEKKWGYLCIIICLIAVLFINPAEADWQDDGSCEQNTYCSIQRFVVNETNGAIVTDGNCTMTIVNPNGTELVNSTLNNNLMTNSSIRPGIYNYTINFAQLGLYPSKMFCDCDDICLINGTDSADVSFVIGSPTNFNNYLYSFLVLLPLALVLFARKYNFDILVMLSGIILAAFGVAIYANRFPFLNFEASLTMRAFSIMVLAVGLYIIGRTAIDLSGEARIED